MSKKLNDFIQVLDKKKASEKERFSNFGKVIDVWCQPPSIYFMESLPESIHLFQKSGTFDFWSEILPDLETSSTRKIISPKDLLSLMDASGIDKLCLCAWARFFLFFFLFEISWFCI